MDDQKKVLFIQGGGDDGYTADAQMVSLLQHALGNDYQVLYPRLESDEALPDFGWLRQIGQHIDGMPDGAILVAHSLGASMLLKHLAEKSVSTKIAGIFLIAAPYWSGNEDWKQGLKLPDHFGDMLPRDIPLFLYHCRDDEEVPFAQLASYEKKLPLATYRKFDEGGHQPANHLQAITNDIKKVSLTDGNH